MVMDRTEAIKALRLSSVSPTRESVLSAFENLCRRYPAQVFPEKHALLLDARDALLKPESAIQSALFDEEVEISWLREASDGPRGPEAEIPPGHHTARDLFGPVLRNSLAGLMGSLSEDDSDEDDDNFGLSDEDFQQAKRLFDQLPPQLVKLIMEKMEEEDRRL